jgi:hypothetical protein
MQVQLWVSTKASWYVSLARRDARQLTDYWCCYTNSIIKRVMGLEKYTV